MNPSSAAVRPGVSVGSLAERGRPGQGVPARGLLPPADGIDPAWLVAAIEHAADSIVITDLDGIIEYVNPAFERETGLTRAQAVGQFTRTFDTGAQSPEVIRSMVATVRRGKIWKGELVHAGPDGQRTYLATTVAPVRDRSGALIGAVAVRRDVSTERALERRLEAYERERTALAAALETMTAGETPEATAAAIATPLLALPGLAGVGLWSFEPTGEVSVLAVTDRTGGPWPALPPLPPERAAHLRERASAGPWIEEWRERPGHPYNEILIDHGLRSLAYVPIRSNGGTIGLLVLAAAEADGLGLVARLPAFLECASVAGALLAPGLGARTGQALTRARIRTLIAERLFHPVFQPIVELAGRTVVGYEALTRFVDGSPPERVFAEAGACGLAVELEAATLNAVLEASGALPVGAWLNLNVSAEFVLAGEPLGSIVRQSPDGVVLELTEHVAVADYAALRSGLARLGPSVRLAVDDAGAGFASLRHILELRPAYVKLDRGIVHGIGADPARQALVAGMVHFAGQTGATLVAEGVESETEAKTLATLGIGLAQGYHLGRPAVAPRRPGAVRSVRSASVVRPVGSPAAPERSPIVREVASGGLSEIERAVNVGAILAPALREVGVSTLAELQATGALPTWERLRRSHPGLATSATLLRLEAAARGIRPTELSRADRDRLRMLAGTRRQVS